MIVTEAQIISGLIIKATGQKSDYAYVTMGRVAQQFPAPLSFPPALGGFFGWEGSFSVSFADVATVNLTTGVGTQYAGNPDFTGLRGVDWEGVAAAVRPYLRAIMIENLGTTALTLFGSDLVGNLVLPQGGILHLSAPKLSTLAALPQSLRFSRLGAAKQTVKITVLLEASD